MTLLKICKNSTYWSEFIICIRRNSNDSASRVKGKWMKAFDHIKGKQAHLSRAEPTPIIENGHVFHENTYKRITPCDFCSQVLRGENSEVSMYNLLVLRPHQTGTQMSAVSDKCPFAMQGAGKLYCGDYQKDFLQVTKCQPKSKHLKSFAIDLGVNLNSESASEIFLY